jgi:ribosomal protein L40E
MMANYMQVIWLYVIGIMVIFVGLYMLMLNSGPGSFVVMLVGLAVAAVGAAHGRKMRMMGQLGVEEIMREKGVVEAQEGQEVPEGAVAEEEEQAAPEEAEEEQQEGQAQPEDQDYVPPQEPVRLGIGSKIGGLIGRFRAAPEEVELAEEDIFNIEMEDIRKGKIAATRADVIKLVCPKCSAENAEQNYFCYKCGNKLRRRPVKEKKEEAEIAVEPGSISIIDDKRVAKVMICPKCNVANKVGDKFCWNCGKKMKSEGVGQRKGTKGKARMNGFESLFRETKGKKRRKGK